MGPSVKVQMYLAFFEGMIGNKNVFTLSFKNILTNHNIGYYTHTHRHKPVLVEAQQELPFSFFSLSS